MTTAIGEFEITGWDQDIYCDLPDGGKLARAHATHEVTGDIQGIGEVHRVMCYRRDGTAHFVGMQHLTGTIAGHTGSVVMRTVGDYDGSKAKGVWSVITGSGTGALANLRGQGDFVAPTGPKAWFTLEYELR